VVRVLLLTYLKTLTPRCRFDVFTSTDKFLVLGRSGCGKSYLARKIQTIYPKRIIFDPLGEYYSERGPGVFHVTSFNEFSAKLVELKQKPLKRFTIVFNFDPETSDHRLIFNECLRLVYYFGNVLVVIEEAQLFATTHELCQWFRNMMLTGRHQGLALLFTSQRPGELHKTILSQCTHVFAGQLIDKNDMNYLSAVFGEKSKTLAHLSERRFLYFKLGIKEPVEVSNSLWS
jgi:hypothetical protein